MTLYSICDHDSKEFKTNQHGTFCVCGQRCYEIPDDLYTKLIKNDTDATIKALGQINAKHQQQITFAAFRKLNIARSDEKYHKSINDWNAAEWGCALAGEVGELLNLVKKCHRGDQIPLNDLASEAGDIVAYLDILCARLGFSLGLAATDKFNTVSEKIGSKFKFLNIKE